MCISELGVPVYSSLRDPMKTFFWPVLDFYRFLLIDTVDYLLQIFQIQSSELGTFEWWISAGLMLDPLFFLISRLNKA